MLIITRRCGEEVWIGDPPEIKITVCQIDKGQVRLGINAPKEISILREEIYDKYKKQNGDKK